MKRRAFIALLGGAAVWPRGGARAAAKDTADRISRHGHTFSLGPMVTATDQRLRELGWIEGRNLVVEYRWAEGRSERYSEIAEEFVRLKVDVILTSGGAVLAVKQATSTIPIVFAVAIDPVGGGLETPTGRKRYRLVAAVQRSCRQAPRISAGAHPRSWSVSGLGQYWLSRRHCGAGRGTGCGQGARSANRHNGHPASPGHSTRVRGGQRPRTGRIYLSDAL